MAKYLVITILIIFFPVSANAVDFDFSDLLKEIENESKEGNTTIIKNSVTSSANTGGNVAESGQAKEGKAKATIDVKTEVNGEVLEEKHEEKEGQGDVKVEAKSETKVENGETKTQTETVISISESKNTEAEETSSFAPADEPESEKMEPETAVGNEEVADIEDSSSENICAGPEEADDCAEDNEAGQDLEPETGTLAGFFINIFKNIKKGLQQVLNMFA